jgi:hypothetical protein
MKAILQFNEDNKLIKEYPSAKDAALATGVGRTNIVKCLQEHYRTAGGFVWRYKG